MSSTGFGSESVVERRLERSCYPTRQGPGSYESCSGDSLSSITGPSSFEMEVRRPPAQDDSHAPFSAAHQTEEMVGILSGGGGDGGIAPSLNLFTCQVCLAFYIFIILFEFIVFIFSVRSVKLNSRRCTREREQLVRTILLRESLSKSELAVVGIQTQSATE